jgi:hypothetical protein
MNANAPLARLHDLTNMGSMQRTSGEGPRLATASTSRSRKVVHRRIALFFTLIIVGLSGIVAAPAAMAASCYGDYCSGRLPEQTGCAADAVTVSATNFSGGRLELRWSPTCKTNWARLQIYSGGFAYTLSAVQDTGYAQNVQWPAGTPGPGTYWTPMIYSPVHRVQARTTGRCFGLFDCATSGQIATGWV